MDFVEAMDYYHTAYILLQHDGQNFSKIILAHILILLKMLINKALDDNNFASITE